ncbi:UNVERIFIED_ORG: hypothetical protein FHR35_008291 [Microbispora rosea subsp. rosea]
MSMLMLGPRRSKKCDSRLAAMDRVAPDIEYGPMAPGSNACIVP